MTAELVFYTHPMSRGRIVRWMLEELGQPYRTELLSYGPAMKSPAYLAINPMGKVPAITHGDVVVTEGAAICAYLADAFPGAGLAPPQGDPARGPYYRWMFFAAGPLEAAVTHRSLGLPDSADPEARGRLGYGRLEDVLAALEGAIGGSEYLVGGRFSAADVVVSSQLAYGMMFRLIDARPVFERYVARLRERPAAVRAKEIDDRLAAG